MLSRRSWIISALAPSFARQAGAENLDWQRRLALLRRLIIDPCFTQLVVREAPTGGMAPSGAVRRNQQGQLFLEEQAAGFAWVRFGVMHDRPAAIQRGWLALDWGLSQQQHDGGFLSADAVHQTTRFAEALACAMVIAPAGANSQRIAGLGAALTWLDQSNRRTHAERNNQTFTHRAWMRASLFEMGGYLLDQPRYHDRATENAKQAMRQQTADGAFPERGGPDVGYQIFGLLFLQRWLAATSNGEVRAQGISSQLAALEWYTQRIRSAGTVDMAGSTRVGIERGKNIRYGRAIEVMLGASLLTGDPRWVSIAAQLSFGAVASGQGAQSLPERFRLDHTGQPAGALMSECTVVN